MTRRRPRQQLRTRKSRHRSSFLVVRYELKTRPMGRVSVARKFSFTIRGAQFFLIAATASILPVTCSFR
jgi:hypothetical protein